MHKTLAEARQRAAQRFKAEATPMHIYKEKTPETGYYALSDVDIGCDPRFKGLVYVGTYESKGTESKFYKVKK